MTTAEFDAEFDVLYNNVTSNQAPGLNGYEKSVFLTKAQNQILSEYFNHKIDIDGGFDGSEERQIDFSNLLVTEALTNIGSPEDYVRIDPRSFIFETSSEITHILNEFLDVAPLGTAIANTLSVVPLSYNEYSRLMKKPYKFPQKGVAWRLINGSARHPRCFELIARDLAGNSVIYRLRYIRKPLPIILENLSPLGVSIENQSSILECELPSEMHHKILERAVTLAKIAWQGGTMTQAGMAVEASRK